MERLTTTSDKGGVAFTFDLEVEATPQEMVKILRLAEKLKYYEDLEEQGRLIKLPCKVGDTVCDNDYGRPCAYTITAFSFGECEEYICEPVTTKEVEAKLKELRGGKEQ